MCDLKEEPVEAENAEVDIVKNERVLKTPLFYRAVALGTSIFCVVVIAGILIFDFEEWPYSLLCLFFFAIPSWIAFVCWSLWKVEIFKDGFSYRNYFGKTQVFKFKDLEHRAHPKGLKWYFYKDGKKVFCMPYYVENEYSLEKAYKKWISKNKKA